MTFRYIAFAAAVVCLASIVQHGDGYRILCVFPTSSFSHQMVFRGLTLALNKRGHELVVVTTDPINDPTLANYTEIDISFGYTMFSSTDYIKIRETTANWLSWIQQVDDGRDFHYMDRILNHMDLRKLYAPESNEKFDLLLVEMLCWQGVYPLATRFDVPMIGISSLGLNLDVLYAIGSPIMSSYPTNWELGPKIYDQLSFWQRLQNFITVWKHLYWFKITHISQHEVIARKYFGNDFPDLNDIEKNVSLIFVNQQKPISYVRPDTPKVIEIGGFHMPKKTMGMPKDLQKFLDEATEGFVYMSLGTSAKSTMLPNKTINEFITTFTRLPYRVLWKFEDDHPPNKPDNVHVIKWVPQHAVLAHPNLKAFIYQGGVQSTEEAVDNAVPLVGLPILCDQDMQVNKMVSLGVGKKLEITEIDGNELFEAISTVASDTRYKQRMLDLRSLLRDKPYDLLENAIWWTEHVIRHRGAPHLHSPTSDIPWYSRQDMDVVSFISAASVMVLNLTLVILYKLFKSIRRTSDSRPLDKKKMN